MRDYAAYGGRLRSALSFPELRALPADPGVPADWTLTVGPPEALVGARRVGGRSYAGGVEVVLLRGADRWRVAVSDLGDFDLLDGTATGDAIVWRPQAGAREDLARFDLLGRVLPVALHRRGALVLHGSSVLLPRHGAVAFLAPRGHGKSTLALALAQRGASLLSDDVTVLDPERAGTSVRPGVHAVRLWPDSADRLAVGAYGTPGAIGRKLVVHGVPDALRAVAPAPLRAVYLLRQPGELPSGRDVAERRELGAVGAALALVRQTTAGGLLGGAEAARVLERAAAVARSAPVYELALVRDFARLDELADALACWHPPRRDALRAGAA